MSSEVNANVYDDEIEIDLNEIFYGVKKRILAICIAGIIGGLAAFLITKLFITPIYTAENSMLVLAKESTSTLSDLQMGSQLTDDYDVLITSRPVLDTVIEKLNLDMKYKELKAAISISKPNDARILVIKVENPDPQLAYDIVREVADEAAEFIGDMMEVPNPKIIDYGVVPEEKTSPSTMKNTAIGLFLGLMLSGGIVVLRAVLDDTIKSEEDIEKYLGLSTLSIVPDRKDYIDQHKDKKAKSNKLSQLLQGNVRGK